MAQIILWNTPQFHSSIKQGKVVTGGITDTEGKFSIDVPEGVYTVKFEFISYKAKQLPNQNLSQKTLRFLP